MSYLVPRLDPHYLNLEAVKDSLLSFDITQSVKGYLSAHPGVSLTPAHFLAFTQKAWRLNPERAEQADYILSIVKTPDLRRQIVGVFVRGRGKSDKFFNSPNDDESRFSILLEPADEDTWNRYVGLFMPDHKQGEANPVQYYY